MLLSMRTAYFVNPRFATGDEAQTQPFNLVIAYDSVAAGQRAMRLFSYLGREHGDVLKFQTQPWRFDLLADPDWCQFAALDAIKADLLIISASSGSDLPVAVRSWISACLARKRGTHAAVVALFGTEEEMDTADSSRLQFVRMAAKEAGLDFFAPLADSAGSASSTTAGIQHRAQTVTQTLDEILRPTPPRRHWGINE